MVEDRRRTILRKGECGWTAFAVAKFHAQESIREVLRTALRSSSIDAKSGGLELGAPMIPDTTERISSASPDNICPVQPRQVHHGARCDNFSYVCPCLCLYTVDRVELPYHIQHVGSSANLSSTLNRTSATSTTNVENTTILTSSSSAIGAISKYI